MVRPRCSFIVVPRYEILMSLDRLTAALADRYTIKRELGAGGMSTVYLAEDLKHHRDRTTTSQRMASVS